MHVSSVLAGLHSQLRVLGQVTAPHSYLLPPLYRGVIDTEFARRDKASIS